MSDVLTEFYQQRPELNVRANDQFLIEAAEKPHTISGLLLAANRLQDSLLLTPAAQSAWDEYRFLNPDKAGLAFRAQFLEQWRVKELKSGQNLPAGKVSHLRARPL